MDNPIGIFFVFLGGGVLAWVVIGILNVICPSVTDDNLKEYVDHVTPVKFLPKAFPILDNSSDSHWYPDLDPSLDLDFDIDLD